MAAARDPVADGAPGPHSERHPPRSPTGGRGPGTAPTAYVRAHGARPCDGVTVRRSGPPWSPSGGPAARNVRRGQWPAGPRPASARAAPSPARSGGRVRWRRRVPHPGCVVPGGAPPPGRCGDPVTVTVVHRAVHAQARSGGRERWRWFLARAGTRPSTRAAPPGRWAAGPVAEETESIDDVVVVRRASACWGVRVCCRTARLESDGYPARRADLCILAV
jgi:hypothetical protein